MFRLGEEDVLALGDEDVWLSHSLSWVNLTSKSLITYFEDLCDFSDVVNTEMI